MKFILLFLLSVLLFCFAEKLTPPVDGPLCNACQYGVQMVKDFSSKPDDELLGMLGKVCERLPAGVQTPCKLGVTLVGKQLLQFVRGHLTQSPKEICTRFQVCGSDKDIVELLTVIKQDSPLCSPCQLGVNLVKDYLNQPDEELMRMLNSGCESLPPELAPVCKMAVALVGKQMIEYVRGHVRDPARQICARFGICATTAMVDGKIVVQDGPLCQPCQLGVQLVKDYINKPDDELMRMLTSACDSLPTDLVPVCKMAVTLVGKQIIEYVRGHLRESPRAICAKFNICAAPVSKADEAFDGILCGPCQFGVMLVKDYLTLPDNELLRILDKACEELPEYMVNGCKVTLLLVGSQVIKYIREHANETPRQVCAKFGICDPDVSKAVALEISQDGPLCQPCQLGVQLVKDYINKPDDELMRMLSSACDSLPTDLITVCKMAVTLVGKQIIEYVRGHLRESPRQICAKFSLCGSALNKLQDGPLCQPCQLGVQLVKDYINQPDDELMRMLSNACESLPTDIIPVCKMAVTLVGKQIIEYIRGHLRETPREICSRFSLCASRPPAEAAQDGPLCGVCQLGVQLVKDYANKPDSELLAMLVAACEKLPSALQLPCKLSMNMLGSELIRYVRGHLNESPRQICGRFRLCGQQVEEASQDGPLCAPCQLGVQLVKDYINKPDDELLRMLSNACESLPTDIIPVCKMAVTLVGKQILEYIRGHLRETPREICSRFSLCASRPPAEAAQDGPLCGVCQLGVQLVKDYANKPDSELRAMLIAACLKLPSELQIFCDLSMNTIGSDLIRYVRGHPNESPRQICDVIRLCGQQVEEASQDGPLCAPCQLGVQLVRDYINKPDDELLRMLSNACESLPTDIIPVCKMAVTLVGKQILEYIRGHLRETPREICSRFSLCASRPPAEAAQDGPLCGVCQLGVQLVKDYANKPDSELLAMLVAACEKLPSALQLPCKLSMNMLGSELIRYVRGHLNESPRQICGRFRLCGQQVEEASQDGPLCAPCQLGVQLVKDYINQPDDELMRMLSNACESLPTDIIPVCKMAVALVGKQIIEYIRGHLRETPREICSRFRMCAASKQ